MAFCLDGFNYSWNDDKYPCTGCSDCKPCSPDVPSEPIPEYSCANLTCYRDRTVDGPGKMCVYCVEVDAKPPGTNLCTKFNKVGGCKFGLACNFIHRVRPCLNVEHGEACPYGDRCNFGGRHKPQKPITIMPGQPPLLVHRPSAAEENELARAAANAVAKWYEEADLQMEQDWLAYARDAHAARY